MHKIDPYPLELYFQGPVLYDLKPNQNFFARLVLKKGDMLLLEWSFSFFFSKEKKNYIRKSIIEIECHYKSYLGLQTIT